MTGRDVVVGGCLAVAAATVAWPVAPARDRQRRVLRGGAAGAGWPAGLRSAIRVALILLRPVSTRWPTRRSIAGVAVACGLMATALGGPVAGVAAGAYAGVAARGLVRWHRDRAARDRRRRTLDALCSLAADLRAGLPPAVAWGAATSLASTGAAALASSPPVDGLAMPGGPSEDAGTDGDARIGRLTAAAWHLAESTGAPLADLIERVEADARVADRAYAAAVAQAAGARATAWLLGALPAGGIALGYAIGADPLQILLHTPLGAVCALTALGLQIAGLAWADRLVAAPRVA
jgi:tight adherence protein B